MASCARCREIAESWWSHGASGDKSNMGLTELDLHWHLEEEHPGTTVTSNPGCRSCQDVLMMSQFALPGLAMQREDGAPVDTARLHFVRHLLEQTADAGLLSSGHTFTAHLYHQPGEAGPTHQCTPDRGHAYHITAEMTAPRERMGDDQIVAIRTVVAELERDLQYRELDRLLAEHDHAESAVDALHGLARHVHATIAARLADSFGGHVNVCVNVDAPEAGMGAPRGFPSAPRGFPSAQ